MRNGLYKVCIVLVLLLSAPFILNYSLIAYEAHKYPPPGNFIKIDGDDIHYLYTGQRHQNSPLVVLIGGSGCSLLEWSIVQPEISKFSRVLSYDRKGLGWSELSSKPRTLENLAKDLYELLRTIPGPYLLVGHSMAGIIIPELVSKYPDLDVQSVVLLDAIEGNYQKYYPNIMSNISSEWLAFLEFYSGYLRISDWYSNASKADAMFDEWTKNSIVANYYARGFLGCYAETSGQYKGDPIFLSNLKKANIISNILIDRKIPVFVISAEVNNYAEPVDGVDNKIWKVIQGDLKTKYGNQIIAGGSDHMINRNAPYVITEFINKIVKISTVKE